MEATPIAGWFLRDNPIKIWMITRGTTISGNAHVGEDQKMKIPLQWACIAKVPQFGNQRSPGKPTNTTGGHQEHPFWATNFT